MLEFLIAGFLTSAGLSCAMTPLIRKLAPTLGLVDFPGHRKVHIQPTPRGGGIAIFFGFFVPTVATVTACLLSGSKYLASIDPVVEAIHEMPGRLAQFLAIGIGACVFVLTGLADDRWNLSWKFRLGV